MWGALSIDAYTEQDNEKSFPTRLNIYIRIRTNMYGYGTAYTIDIYVAAVHSGTIMSTSA